MSSIVYSLLVDVYIVKDNDYIEVLTKDVVLKTLKVSLFIAKKLVLSRQYKIRYRYID